MGILADACATCTTGPWALTHWLLWHMILRSTQSAKGILDHDHPYVTFN
jgi:hypothetical protein